MSQAENTSAPKATWRDRFSRRHFIGAAAASVVGALAYPLVSRLQGTSLEASQSGATLAVLSTGLELHREGKYEEAIQEFTNVVRSHPELPAAYLFRGIALFNAGEPDAALTDFSRVLELRPDDAVVYLYRGDAYAALGLKDRAASDFQAAASLAGGDDRIEVAARAKLQKVSDQ